MIEETIPIRDVSRPRRITSITTERQEANSVERAVLSGTSCVREASSVSQSPVSNISCDPAKGRKAVECHFYC